MRWLRARGSETRAKKKAMARSYGSHHALASRRWKRPSGFRSGRGIGLPRKPSRVGLTAARTKSIGKCALGSVNGRVAPTPWDRSTLERGGVTAPQSVPSWSSASKTERPSGGIGLPRRGRRTVAKRCDGAGESSVPTCEVTARDFVRPPTPSSRPPLPQSIPPARWPVMAQRKEKNC